MYQATTGKYPYSPPQATAVADKWFCQKQYTNFSKEISENDICSEYYFSDHFMCMVSEAISLSVVFRCK